MEKIEEYIYNLLDKGNLSENDVINNISNKFNLDIKSAKEIVIHLALKNNWNLLKVNYGEQMLGLKEGVAKLPKDCNPSGKTLLEAMNVVVKLDTSK